MTSREDLLALFAPATRPVTLLNGHTVHVREVSVEDGETMAQRLAGCTTEHQRLVVMAGVYLSDQHGQPIFLGHTPDDQAVLKNSFASNGECGLKHRDRLPRQRDHHNSFASNGECGLKLYDPRTSTTAHSRIHSPAMANVD